MVFNGCELFGWHWTRCQLIAEAVVEQFSYGPSACICFFFGMSLLEGKSLSDAIFEVKTKFVPTYKYGIFIWPAVATVNYLFVPARNRVPFISVCSFMWTNFLAYMKEAEARRFLQTKASRNVVLLTN